MILYFPQYFRSWWWCLCEPVIRLTPDMWVSAANHRPVFRSRDQSGPMTSEYCEASIGGSRVTSGNRGVRWERGKIVSERSTVGCHHLEIRRHEWDPFEEYFVMTIARTLWIHCYFENWASLQFTVIFRGVGTSIQSLEMQLLIKVPFPIQTIILICFRFYFLFSMFNICPLTGIKSHLMLIWWLYSCVWY